LWYALPPLFPLEFPACPDTRLPEAGHTLEKAL